MNFKKIFACALASVFTAATVITHPTSAANSAESIGENQKIICSETSGKFEEITSDCPTEKNAGETDSSDVENLETKTDEADPNNGETGNESVDADEQNEKDQSNSATEETTAADDAANDGEESLELNEQIQRLKTKNKILKEKNKRLKIKTNILKLANECARKVAVSALAFFTSILLIQSKPGTFIIDALFGRGFSDATSSNTRTLSAVPALIALLWA